MATSTNKNSNELNNESNKNVCNENKSVECTISDGQDSIEHVKYHTYEDAIELAGNGRYNRLLLAVLSVVLISMLLDMFGFSVVVASSRCEFQLTVSQQGILTSMPFVGTIVMSYPWGYFSDTKGRKPTLLLAMWVSFVVSAISCLSPDWKVMAALKLVGTSFSSAAQSAAYVLLGECCGQRVRGFYMLLMTSSIMLTPSIYYSLGYVILNLDFNYELAFLNIWFTPWRLLALLLAIPLGISAAALTFFCESPKFLANIGKQEEAVDALHRIYAVNGGDPGCYPVKYLVIEEQLRKTDQNIMASIWNQTVPLFKPPLLTKTLQLFYVTFVLYSVGNSFLVWFPFLSEAIFSGEKNIKAGGGVCELITNAVVENTDYHIGNITSTVPTVCTNRLRYQTVLMGLGHSLSFTLLNLIMSRFSARKKLVMMLCLGASIVGGAGATFAPEPSSATILYIMFMVTALGMGITSSYFVDLYPTSYRGMVSCLGVMVARFSSLTAINLVGAVILDHCRVTIYSFCVLVFSGIIVTWFLPPDKAPNKAKENK